MRRLLLPGGAVVLVSVSLLVAVSAPSHAVPERVARLDPYLRLAARLARQLDTPSTRGQALARLRALDDTVALELDKAPPSAVVRVAGHPSESALGAVGARLVSPGAATRLVRVPLHALERLAAVGGVRFVEAQARVRRRLDTSVPLTGAAALHDADPAVTGVGVVYGSIDDGIDIRHPTFRNLDGTTRIEAFWDLCDMSGDPPPGFRDFGGTLYTADDIDAELEGDNRFPHVDTGGHGTMTAGIGAGSGAGGEFVGMAPGAAIVVVAIFGDEVGNCDNPNVMNEFGGGSSVVSEGARFIESWAAGRPFVVNMSLGDHVGPHDGSSLLDRDLEAIATAAPGRALVAAAGNEGEGGVHAGIMLPGDGQVHGIDAMGLYGYDGAVELWYPGDAQVEIRVRQREACGSPVATGGDELADAYYIDNARDGVDGRNQDNVALVEMYGDLDPAGDELACSAACDRFVGACGSDPFGMPGACQDRCMTAWNAERVDCVATFEPRWGGVCEGAFYRCLPVEFTVEVRAVGGAPVRVDLYGAGFATALDGAPGPDMTIGEPASSHGVVAVAAFVHHAGQGAQGALGDLTSYSSHGPLRDGRDKPEIAAPAELVTSALADGYDPFGAEISDDGLWQTISGGTSAASPHVAGAIALLLEVEPDADLARIHEALARGADVDARTGAVPSNGWGWGKLQIEDAVLGLADEIADTDGDGFGAVAEGGIDCDDANEAIGPRMAEAGGNGVDDDCDGQIDEPLPEGGFFERMDPECPDEVEPDAGVDAGPPPPDAGLDATAPDAATGEDAGTQPPGMHATGGGCGCRAAPADGRGGGLAWLALGLGLALRRRAHRPAHQH